MKFKNFTKEAVCELLCFLAEHEDFGSLKELKGLSKEEVAEIFMEIVLHLREDMIDEGPNHRLDHSGFNLSPKSLSLISCLSPREEMLLFRSFKLL